MTTEHMIPAHEVVGTITAMFHRAGPCHCHTVAKLGEQDILDGLLRRRVIDLADLKDTRAIPIEMLAKEEGGELPDGAVWRLRYHNIHYLRDLERFTVADLAGIQSMGMKNAFKLERFIARFGISLRGGNPALLAAERDKPMPSLDPLGEPAAPSEGMSPEGIREQTAEALFNVANDLFADGKMIMTTAAKLMIREAGDGRKRSWRRSLAALKRYASDSERGAAAHVQRLLAPLVAMEAADKALAKAGRKARVEAVETRLIEYGDEHPNVVRLRAS